MILQQITHTISSVLSTLATLPSAENTANRPSVTVSKLYLDPQKVTHKHKRQTNAIDLWHIQIYDESNHLWIWCGFLKSLQQLAACQQPCCTQCALLHSVHHLVTQYSVVLHTSSFCVAPVERSDTQRWRRDSTLKQQPRLSAIKTPSLAATLRLQHRASLWLAAYLRLYSTMYKTLYSTVTFSILETL